MMQYDPKDRYSLEKAMEEVSKIKISLTFNK